MTPSAVPVQAATTAAQPAATNVTPPNAAPAGDFLTMLGQLVGAATPASAPAPIAGVLTATVEGEEPAATDGVEGAEVPGLFALSLPVMPTQLQRVPQIASDGTEAIQTAVGTLQTRSAAVAPEAQLLTDLIQSEQQPEFSLDGPLALDAPSLPIASEPAAAKAQSLSPTDQIVSRPVHHPVGSAAWADEIGSRLTLMAEHGKHTASLKLSPEHLGPLEIRIAVQDDQASVWFGAAHADTRAAIETALPRLRELFASQGLSLADAGVYHEAPKGQSGHAAPQTTSGPLSADDESAAAASRQVRLGLIDAYA